MLVDLARNDIGRVCEFGSIHVPEFMFIERYSHVMHIVSQVEGQIAPDKNAFDLMRATFPAGTVSGAPKVRAMQIIAEKEPVQRGFYAGALGYFGYDGNLDSCITLRTALLRDGHDPHPGRGRRGGRLRSRRGIPGDRSTRRAPSSRRPRSRRGSRAGACAIKRTPAGTRGVCHNYPSPG